MIGNDNDLVLVFQGCINDVSCTLILVDREITPIGDGVLGDIAPTILKLMALEIPKVMTGNILV